MGKTCPTCNVSYQDGSIFCPADGTTLRSVAENSDDLVGTVIADRYLLTDKLGEGGMGRVYLARHVRVPRQAAIKVLRSVVTDDYDVIAAFTREANNAARMGNHAHVAEVYDFGETAGGLLYLAMEYVDGEPLSRLLERERVLPPTRAAEIARQVAEALTVAHELPIPVIHRDLKPDNIMLARNRDGSDCVKVVDFGIAKAIRGETQKLTSPGLAVGTPRYMSPEQLTATDSLDARSDIYSLGLIAFQMLTGKMPFPSQSAEEESSLTWAVRRLGTAPSPLARMKSDVAWPPTLQRVFDRVLATSPDDRYASAEMFARDLLQGVDELEGAAGKSGVVGQRLPAVRTSRRLVALIAGGVAVALTFAVLALDPGGVLRKREAGSDGAQDAPSTKPALPARPDTAVRTQADGGDLGEPAATRAKGTDSSTRSDTARGIDRNRVPLRGPTTSMPRLGTDSGRIPAASGATTRDESLDMAAGARAALDSIDKLLANRSSPTAEQATRILETLHRIRPHLGTEDDLRAQVYAAEALLVFGETAEACKLLRAVERRGAGTDAGRMAQRYLNPPKDLPQLNCPE